jgi:hypothetical protein
LKFVNLNNKLFFFPLDPIIYCASHYLVYIGRWRIFFAFVCYVIGFQTEFISERLGSRACSFYNMGTDLNWL